MTSNCYYRWLFVAALLMSCGIVGCADGPFNGGGTLNPWLKKEWDKDEKRGPTFHTKIAALKQLAAQAQYLPADRQESMSIELAERFKNEPNSLLRAELIQVVGNLNGSVVDETLKLAMKDNDAEVRIAATRALGRRGNEAALETLAAAMADDTNLDVRISIAAELRNFKNSAEATRALGLALEDNDTALQYKAIKSLEEVTGRNYGVNASAWREYLAGGNPAPAPPVSIADRVKGYVWW